LVEEVATRRDCESVKADGNRSDRRRKSLIYRAALDAEELVRLLRANVIRARVDGRI
jgi:hypothetical protein